MILERNEKGRITKSTKHAVVFLRENQDPISLLSFCTECKLELTGDRFYWKKSKADPSLRRKGSSCCKTCISNSVSKNNMKKETRRRYWIARYKETRGCDHCGFNKSHCALDFHHHGHKEKGVSNMLTWSLKKIFHEIRQCIILCANCHRMEHARERREAKEAKALAA